jgi:hypothetical protein
MLAPGRLDRHPGSWARTGGQLRTVDLARPLATTGTAALGSKRGHAAVSAERGRSAPCVNGLALPVPAQSGEARDSLAPARRRAALAHPQRVRRLSDDAQDALHAQAARRGGAARDGLEHGVSRASTAPRRLTPQAERAYGRRLQIGVSVRCGATARRELVLSASRARET